MKLSITLFFCLLAFPGTESILASVPPHSRVLELIRRGEIPVPYYLKNLANIRSSGVNAPWSAPRHRDNMGTSSVGRPKLGLAATPAGSWRALVILTQFTDHPSSVSTTSFDQIVFGTSFGTVHDYYHTVSYGRLDIVTVNLPSSTGWKTMPHPYSYYVNGQNGFGSYPQNAQRLVEDALNAVAGVVDFKNYDNDGDGYVDALFVVHSGPGAEFTGSNNDIWSHSWTTSSPQLHNGVYVFHYAMVPEYWSTPGDMTCGVYCHELGHALFGLPDLYDTDYSSEGLGRWTIMAGGSWNGPNGLGGSPALMDAWCLSQMGFAKVQPVATTMVAAPIYRREDSSAVYRLWRNGDVTSPEYFLVENRQQAGYDSYLPGNGLCVYHVDDDVTTGNDEEWYPGHTSNGHYQVALEQADGRYDLERDTNSGDAGDPFPGSTNKTSFTNTTVPDSRDYNFADTYVRITDIGPSSQVMYANLSVSLVKIMSIALARRDSNADYIPDLVGDTVSVEGTVTSPNLQLDGSGAFYFVQDTTAGIAVRGPALAMKLDTGDRVQVTGIVAQSKGLTLLAFSDSASVKLVGKGNPLPQPTLLTVGQYLASPEAYEGSLVRVNHVRLAAGSQPWPASGASASISVVDSSSVSSLLLYLDGHTNIGGSEEIGYPADVIGVAAQRTTSAVPSDSAQLFVRYRTDFVPNSSVKKLPLTAGFNLVSWNVDPSVDSLPVLLGGILPKVSVVLGFDNGGETYVPTLLKYSTLVHGDASHGYWIKMTQPDTLTLTGTVISPHRHLPLSAGYNLVSYLPQFTDSAAHALSSVMPELTVVLGFNGGGVTYDPQLPGFSTLRTMEPLAGYWIKMNAGGTLVYPESTSESVVMIAQGSPARLAAGERVSTTAQWVSLYGSGLRLNNALLKPGTVIQARNEAGLLCGECVVGSPGQFGFLEVYGDDPRTSAVDGMKANEEIQLFADGVRLPLHTVWTSFGDVIQASVVTATGEANAASPKEFSLEQNYPNPCNPSTTIRFTLPTPAFVVLDVIDVLGRRVREPIREQMTEGNHSIGLNMSNLASGVYWYRLVASANGGSGEQRLSAVKELIVLK